MVAIRSAVLGLALALALPALAAPSQVHLGWQGATDTTMTVTWRSTEATGSVEYGADASYGRVAAAASIPYEGSYLHEASVTGLEPGTTYHYRCGSASSWAPDRSFTTGPRHAATAGFRFAAYGDSRSDDATRRRVRAAVQGRAPAFSINTGDIVENGLLQPQWDEWFAAMEPLLAVTPVMPAIGNHEAGSTLYYRQFAMPTHQPAAAGYPDESYYSFDYGNTHFVALSSENPWSAGSAQYAWLEADLARSAADPATRWTVVFFHRPPYSSGNHGSDLGLRSTWGALFEKYGVDIVVTGHDHDYERTHPMKGGRIAEGGVVYLVSGGAGAPLRTMGQSDFTAFGRSAYHFLEVDVTATQLSLEARDDAGNVFDSLTLVNDAAVPADGPVAGCPAGGGDPACGGSGGSGDSGGGGSASPGPGSAGASGGCGAGGGASLASVAALVVGFGAARRRRRA